MCNIHYPTACTTYWITFLVIGIFLLVGNFYTSGTQASTHFMSVRMTNSLAYHDSGSKIEYIPVVTLGFNYNYLNHTCYVKLNHRDENIYTPDEITNVLDKYNMVYGYDKYYECWSAYLSPKGEHIMVVFMWIAFAVWALLTVGMIYLCTLTERSNYNYVEI